MGLKRLLHRAKRQERRVGVELTEGAKAGILDALKQEQVCVSQQSRATGANHSEQIPQPLSMGQRERAREREGDVYRSSF